MRHCFVRPNAQTDCSVTNAAAGTPPGRKGVFSCLSGINSGLCRARFSNPQASPQALLKSMLSKLFPSCSESISRQDPTLLPDTLPDRDAIMNQINQNRIASYGMQRPKPSKECQKILDLLTNYHGFKMSADPAAQMKALFDLIRACNSYLAAPHKASGQVIDNLKQCVYREILSLGNTLPDVAGPSNNDHARCLEKQKKSLERQKTIIGLMRELNLSIPSKQRTKIDRELQGYEELLDKLNQPGFAALTGKFECAVKSLENNIEEFAKQKLNLCSHKGKTLHAYAKLHTELHRAEIEDIFAEPPTHAEIKAAKPDPSEPQGPAAYNSIGSDEFKNLMIRIDNFQVNLLNFRNNVIGSGRDSQFDGDLANLLSFFRYVRAIALYCPQFMTDPILKDLIALEHIVKENFQKVQKSADGDKISSLFEGISGFPMFTLQRNVQKLRIEEPPTVPEQDLLAGCLEASMMKMDKLLNDHSLDMAQRRSFTDINNSSTQETDFNSSKKLQFCFYQRIARLKDFRNELKGSLESLKKKEAVCTEPFVSKSANETANASSTMQEAMEKLFNSYLIENDLSMINMLIKIDQVVEDTLSEIQVMDRVWKPARKIVQNVLPNLSTISQISKRIPLADPPSGIKRGIAAAKKYAQENFFTKWVTDIERINRRREFPSMPKPKFTEWQYSFQNPSFGVSRPIAEIIYDKLTMINSVADVFGKEILGNSNANIAKSRSKLLTALKLVMKADPPKSTDSLIDSDEIVRHAHAMVRHASDKINNKIDKRQREADIGKIMKNPKEYFDMLTFIADFAKKMINDDFINLVKSQLANERFQEVEFARIAYKMLIPNYTQDQGALENPWLQKILDAKELDRLENPTRKTEKLVHMKATLLRFIPIIGEMVVVQKQFFDDHKLTPGMFSKIDVVQNSIFFGEQAFEGAIKK